MERLGTLPELAWNGFRPFFPFQGVPNEFQCRSKAFQAIAVNSTLLEVPMKSIHAFCKDHQLAKSSVYRKCQELGIPTTDGLSDDDCQLLLNELGLIPVLLDRPVDISQGGAMVPIFHTVDVVIPEGELVAPRLHPQVLVYDTSEIDSAAALNQETLEFNINAMGTKLVEQMKQLGRLHGAQARQAYAHSLASELGMVGKPADGTQ